jgi:hypothetical protein
MSECVLSVGGIILTCKKVKVKIKLSRYRPWASPWGSRR